MTNRNSSIYAIRCKENGKIYIGVSVECKKRILAHVFSLKNGTHKIKQLQEDFNKYGIKAFEYYELEDGIAWEKRSEKEDYYIDYYNATNNQYGYNTRKNKSGLTAKVKIKRSLPPLLNKE